MNTNNCPLSSKNYTDINRALGLINDLQIELDNAEKAGYPVDEHRTALDYFRKLFDKTKSVYFSGKP